jgi:hypothetical protein
VCRFFGDGEGAPLRWQACAYATSPPATRATVQKFVNDVVTQTP